VSPRRKRRRRPFTFKRFARSWGWTAEEIYVYRGRKPHAPIGLPVIGRHFVYGGRTCDPGARDSEHMTGVSRRSSGEPSPWSDLDVRRYTVFSKKPRPEWLTAFLERLVIKGLFCVYNWQDRNRLNPRTIPPKKARVQRANRDRTGGFSTMSRFVFRVLVYVSLIGLSFWTYGAVINHG
jgi:hypothetical protein